MEGENYVPNSEFWYSKQTLFINWLAQKKSEPFFKCVEKAEGHCYFLMRIKQNIFNTCAIDED